MGFEITFLDEIVTVPAPIEPTPVVQRVKPTSLKARPDGGVDFALEAMAPPTVFPKVARVVWLDPPFVANLPDGYDRAAVAEQVFGMTDRPHVDLEPGGPTTFNVSPPAGTAPGDYAVGIVSQYAD